MSGFYIKGLPLSEFSPLFGLTTEVLAQRNILRQVVTCKPGFPCRVSLQDAEPGESVLLINYEHHAVANPYRSRHAIYVRENAEEVQLAVNEVPLLLRHRLLSLRCFDHQGMMLDADVTEGQHLEAAIRSLFKERNIAYLHIHNAKPGCYAARVDRVG